MSSEEYIYVFTPTPEMTAYDLARIFTFADGWLDARDYMYETLPDDLKVYYKVKKPKREI